ncbi:MAG TPA: hypothetical protein PLP29_11120 [Candidatus Ozemobacteraceae bacterium]|nr:hypothetical protein [Candidatus Ozemobacteraceae bacterium]
MTASSIVKYIYRIVFLFVAVLVSASGAGAAEGGWASVDVRLLLALHPSMASFDYSHDRFFRGNAPSGDAAALGQALQAAWEKAQPKLRELGVRREKLNQSKFEILQRREETMRNLLEKEATQPGQVRDREKQIGEYEDRYTRAMAECDAQLARLEKEFEQAQEEAYTPVYLTKDETARQIASIKQEIEALIAQTAQENRIGVVLDTSFGRGSLEKNQETVTVPQYPEPSDTLASRLFHTFSNWAPPPVPETTVPGPNGQPIPAREHVAFAASQNMIQTLERYLEFRPYLTKTAANFSSGNIFLGGGTDLTATVARKIFSRYRVPPEIQNSFQVLIQKYAQFDKTSGM